MPNTHSDQPASRADVLALGERMEGLLQKLGDKVLKLDDKVQKLDDRLTQTRDDVLEAAQEMVRDAQTELLRGFRAFSNAQDIRIRKVQADLSNVDAATDLRLLVLERRLLEIEQRLHIPPPPQLS